MARKMEDFEYKKSTDKNSAILGTLEGPCADIVDSTRNGRKYSEELWEKAFQDPIVQEQLANGGIFGEAGHPADREEVDIEKIAIAMPEAPKKGPDGKLIAKFHILDTPCGRVLKTLCDYGYKIGISSRGTGDVVEDYNGDSIVDPDTYSFTCFDAVLVPSVKAARMDYVAEGLDKRRYNKTLRQRLAESLAKASDKDKKLMKETLDTLGIEVESKEKLTEAVAPEKYTAVLRALNDAIEDDSDVDGIKKFLCDVKRNVESMADDFGIELDCAEDLDEGAEGKREPGFEYVIYDDTDTMSKETSPIVGIRSTRVEAAFLAQKLAAKSGHEKSINYEKVPKGRFKVGDAFYGPFDANWNLRESTDTSLVINPTERITLIYQDEEVMDFVEHGDEDAYDDLIQNCEEVADEEGKEHITFNIKYDDDVAEWYPEESLEECNTNECADKSSETVFEGSEAEDNGTENLVEQLQDLLKENAQLKKQMQDLQNKIAVKDTEATKVTEALAHYKSATAALSAKAKESKALEKKVSTLTEKLNKKEKDSKARVSERLKESIKTSKEVAQLTEAAKQNSLKVKQLTEELEEAKANAELKRSEYNKTITKAKALIKEYKELAHNTVDRYIESKATALGVSANEIRNRLNESYSVDEIDKICEELQSYQVNISRLPFNLDSRMKITESKKESLKVRSPFDDDVDEDLLALARMRF